MQPLLLTLLLSAAPAAADDAATTGPAPATADAVLAAAFNTTIDTKAALEKGVERSPWSSMLAPGFALLALAALAFALTRGRPRAARNITLVESTGLGPKRSLVIADVMGERLVLGVSEAGITVLSARPAPQPEPAPFVVPPPVTASAQPPQMGFFDRLLGRVPRAAATASFEDSLRDSLEDQELRAKLALGQRSVVP